jgi:hypothetical protein
MINQGNVADSISYLISNDNVFERLKSDFPEILADLITFKSNPNCSCKGRVIKYFSDQLAINSDILEKYIYDQNALAQHLTQIQEQRLINTYSGRIITIPKGEQAWANFQSELVNKMFRGFSIVEREDSVAVYFL